MNTRQMDVSPADLKRAFLSPPPELLQRSALYTSLPEAALHDGRASVTVMPHGNVTLSQLPSRMARERIRVRAVSAQTRNGPARLCTGRELDFPATSYMLQQKRDVNAFRAAYYANQRRETEAREARLDALRTTLQQQEHNRVSASTRRKKLQVARQLAVAQLLQQHAQERQIVLFDEQRRRDAYEHHEQKQRLQMACSLWQGVKSIQLETNTQRLFALEGTQRARLIEDGVGDFESRCRHFVARLYATTKSHLLSLEKAARITLMKRLALQQAWKREQDTALNIFATQERRARQKVCDDEAFGFIEIDAKKQNVLQEQARMARRRQEELIAQRHLFEQMQCGERKELEKAESELRQNARNDESNVRAAIRSDYTEEKLAAAERTEIRRLQEQREWEAECLRQVRPLLEEESNERSATEREEGAAFNELSALHSQEWADILLPVAVAMSREDTYFCHGGAAVPLLSGVTFQRKPYSSYATQTIAEAAFTVCCVSGSCVGDEVDVLAAEVSGPKEKPKYCPTGLRLLDSAILDEDGKEIASIERATVGSASIDSVQSCEAYISAEQLMRESNLPKMTLHFVSLDEKGLQSVVERVVNAVIFRADPTCTDRTDRTFETTFSFSFLATVGSTATPTSTGSVRRIQRVTPRKSRAKPTYTISRTTTIRMLPPLYAIGPCLSPHTCITFDTRKRPEGTKYYINLLNGLTPISAPTRKFSSGQVKLRFVEGLGPEEVLHFNQGDGFSLKKDEVRLEGYGLVARVTGKISPQAPASTKEIVFTLSEDPSMTSDTVERLLGRLQYSCLSAEPLNQKRAVEVTVTEVKHPGLACSISTTLRCEILITGLEDNLTVRTSDAPVILRDSFVVVPEQFYKHLKPNRVFVCPNALLELHNALLAKDSAAGASFRVSIIHAAFPWDELAFQPAPASLQGALTTEWGSAGDGKVMWCAGGETNATQIATMQRVAFGEGRLAPTLRVDFTDGKSSMLQMLLRSLVLSTRSPPATLGCTKVVGIEVYVPEPPTRKNVGSPPPPPCVARTYLAVRVLPSAVVSDAPVLSVAPAPTHVRAAPFHVSRDCQDEIFDGGKIIIDIVEGRTGMEELTLLSSTPSPPRSPQHRSTSLASSESTAFESPHQQDLLRQSVKEGDATAPPFKLEKSNAREQLIMKGQTLVGTLQPLQHDGRAMVLTFSGKRRCDSRLDIKGEQKANCILRGDFLNILVCSMHYLHSDDDPLFRKLLHLTLDDSFGRVSQAVCSLNIVPVHLPSELADPPPLLYYRSGLVPLTQSGILPLFARSTIIDEDTEFCGVGSMVVEPYVGVTEDDRIVWIPTSEAPDQSIALQPKPAEPNSSFIMHEGKEMGTLVDEPALQGSSNAFKIAINHGVPLEVCTKIMRRIGFIHTSRFPTRCHLRKFQFRFNAGDEIVPDTIETVCISVDVPLLHTLPLYESMKYREGAGLFSLFPKLRIGCPSGASIADDELRISIRNALPEDQMFLQQDEDIYADKSALLCSIGFARNFTNAMVVPSAGYSGLLVGSVELLENAALSMKISPQCTLPAAAVKTILSLVNYRNTSVSPTLVPRDVELTWKRKETGEEGRMVVTLVVEGQDNMTEVVIPILSLSSFVGEECLLAKGASVSDPDTPVFNSGSVLSVRIQGSGQDDAVGISATVPSLVTQESDLLYNGKRVAVIDPPSPAYSFSMHLDGCPIEVLQLIVAALAYTPNKLGPTRSKLCQISLKAAEATQTTIVSVQVTVYSRPLRLETRSVEHFPGRPAPLLHGVSSQLQLFAGITITLTLKGSGDLACRSPILGMDRIVIQQLPEHLLRSRVSITTRSGQTLCNIGEDAQGSILRFAIPRTSKVATWGAVAELLASVAYEYGEATAIAGEGAAEKDARKPPRKHKAADEPTAQPAVSPSKKTNLICELKVESMFVESAATSYDLILIATEQH